MSGFGCLGLGLRIRFSSLGFLCLDFMIWVSRFESKNLNPGVLMSGFVSQDLYVRVCVSGFQFQDLQLGV